MSELADKSLRLDLWLWHARFFKTRALSGAHVKKRGARITRLGQTRRVNKPGISVLPGDIVTFGKGPHIQTIEILALGERRGPASEAQALYRVIEEDGDV